MSVTAFLDLPMADRRCRWDGRAADERVRVWTGAVDAPNPRYRAAHLWYDPNHQDSFAAYKLLIADVIDGELLVVPKAVIQAAAVVDGAYGGIDLPHRDARRVRHHLAAYYARLGLPSPWQD